MQNSPNKKQNSPRQARALANSKKKRQHPEEVNQDATAEFGSQSQVKSRKRMKLPSVKVSAEKVGRKSQIWTEDDFSFVNPKDVPAPSEQKVKMRKRSPLKKEFDGDQSAIIGGQTPGPKVTHRKGLLSGTPNLQDYYRSLFMQSRALDEPRPEQEKNQKALFGADDSEGDESSVTEKEIETQQTPQFLKDTVEYHEHVQATARCFSGINLDADSVINLPQVTPEKQEFDQAWVDLLEVNCEEIADNYFNKYWDEEKQKFTYDP